MCVQGAEWTLATGSTGRRLTFEKDRARVEMEQEQSKHDRAGERRQRTLHQNRVRQMRKSLTDTRTTLCSLSETL